LERFGHVKVFLKKELAFRIQFEHVSAILQSKVFRREIDSVLGFRIRLNGFDNLIFVNGNLTYHGTEYTTAIQAQLNSLWQPSQSIATESQLDFDCFCFIDEDSIPIV
jgi:hypothetical protein